MQVPQECPQVVRGFVLPRTGVDEAAFHERHALPARCVEPRPHHPRRAREADGLEMPQQRLHRSRPWGGLAQDDVTAPADHRPAAARQ